MEIPPFLPREEEIIKREVRNAIQRVFPGINIGRRFQHELSFTKQADLDTGDSQTSVIVLTKRFGGSLQTSAPLTIAGSDVSVASIIPSQNDGGKATAFSRLSQGTDAASIPQMFATTQWKPKEPPCFYGRSSEDVHTWTSLVRQLPHIYGG